MYWEQYLRVWRGGFGRREKGGWLCFRDRVKHILGFAGVYSLIASFSLCLVMVVSSGFVLRALASLFWLALFASYIRLYQLYDKVEDECADLWQLDPRG